MTDFEIRNSYRTAKYKEQQIQIIADLSGTNETDVIRVLISGGVELPQTVLRKWYRRLDKLDEQIREQEKEYKAIADALKGASKHENSIYMQSVRGKGRRRT